jgi:hypothetical protein
MLQIALDGSQAKTIKKSCLTKTNQLIYGVLAVLGGVLAVPYTRNPL